MASESTVFALLTVVVVAGTAVLLAGVGAFEETHYGFIAGGGTVMVAGILAMAGYISALDEPEDHGAEDGHEAGH